MAKTPNLEDDPIMVGRSWLFPDGTTLPVVSGGDGGENDDDEEENDDEDENDEDDDEDKSKSKVLKMTQDKLSQLTTRQHKKGEREGRKAVLKELGFTTIEEAKAAYSESQQQSQEKDDKDKKELEQERRAAEAAKAEAAKAQKTSQIERRLLRTEGFVTKNLDHAVRMLGVEDLLEADDDEIDEAIEKLQEDLPALWKSEDDDDEEKPKRVKPRRTTPPGPPKKRQASTADVVRSRLEKRHGEKLAKK